jgi:glycosyltransferase involved in cell wall biosynthesis
MYLLFIARGYPTDKYKTYGIFEFDQAKALVNKGHKVVYAAVDLRSFRRWRKWGVRKLKIDGVDIYAINIPIGKVPRNMLNRFGFMALKILYKKIIKEHGVPDIMHAHFTDYAYYACKLKDITGVPLVVTEHSSHINKDNVKKDLYNIAREAYNKADRLIAVSPSLSKRINKHFNVNPIFIPNIVDLKVFRYQEKEKYDSFNFVSIGNLIDIKRMDLTIEAFYEAFRNNSKVTLTIFGQGPKRKMLQDLIDRYNLNDQVKLMGLCSREKIAEQFRKTDCFVLASQTETFGVAYIEALSMGVPVIATKCGGPEVFVNKKNGLLIEVDNKKQLVEAMKYMYNNINRYDRREIAMETKEKFSPEIIADKIIKVYEGVLSYDRRI